MKSGAEAAPAVFRMLPVQQNRRAAEQFPRPHVGGKPKGTAPRLPPPNPLTTTAHGSGCQPPSWRCSRDWARGGGPRRPSIGRRKK
eukprot:48613-Pyramimonas_sp.AAC.1